MTKRVMVIGCGQVGTFTARALAEMGANVVGADVKPSLGYFRRFSQLRDAPLLSVDICDSRAVSELFRMQKIDVVVVTAGPVGQAVTRDLNHAWKVHTKGAEVATRCASRAGVRRLVFVSSLSVYGRPDTPFIDEETIPQPESAYGRTKLAAEEAVLGYDAPSLERCILRPCGVYGPVRIGVGSHSARFLEMLLLRATKQKDVVIESSLNSWDQYLYVKDLGRAIALVALAQTASRHSVFNVGPGVTSDAHDLHSALQAAVPGARITVQMNGRARRLAMPPLNVLRISEAHGFSPEYSLSRGLRDYAKEARFVK